MRAAILDYGAGNLYSLARAVNASGAEAVVTADVAEAISCDALLLPGVGAFGYATSFIDSARDQITSSIQNGMPCLGICLGMQLLFDNSEEGEGRGLGIIPGVVRKLEADRVPQIGWNDLDDVSEPTIASSGLSTAFFANSYVCEPDDRSVVTGWATHEGDRFPSSVRKGNVVGVQFHPEKSSSAGVAMIAAFLAECGR